MSAPPTLRVPLIRGKEMECFRVAVSSQTPPRLSILLHSFRFFYAEKLWASSSPIWLWLWKIWRSISPLKYRWVTRSQCCRWRWECGKMLKCSSVCLKQVLDDKNVRRRFRASNYQSTTRVKPFICTMPMRLDDGWNQVGALSATPILVFFIENWPNIMFFFTTDSVQSGWLHSPCLRHQLCWDPESSNPRQLPDQARLFLRPLVFRGRAARRIQAVSSSTAARQAATTTESGNAYGYYFSWFVHHQLLLIFYFYTFRLTTTN